jgi:hypothetical protein
MPAHSFDLPWPFTPCRKHGLAIVAFALVNKGLLLKLRCALSSQLLHLSYGAGYLRGAQPLRPRLYRLSFQLGRTWLVGKDQLIPNYGETDEQFPQRAVVTG